MDKTLEEKKKKWLKRITIAMYVFYAQFFLMFVIFAGIVFCKFKHYF